jgi:hypothetical protein
MIYLIFYFLILTHFIYLKKFAIMESVMSTVIDAVKLKFNTPKKVITLRALICLIYFGCGLTMVTNVGFYLFSLV